jgi:hypothetical protein
MDYNAKKIQLPTEKGYLTFEVGKENVKSIDVDTIEKVIRLVYDGDGEWDTKLIPIQGPTDILYV